MKQHRTRQRHPLNRNHTPSVICLPPPLVTLKRADTAPALALHGADDPLVPLAATVPVTSSVPVETRAPLPRNRSLAPTRKGMIVALVGWLRRSAWRAPKRRDTNAIGQLQALRDEVAALQISLDRTLEGMAA